jgi:hypothetical protein
MLQESFHFLYEDPAGSPVLFWKLIGEEEIESSFFDDEKFNSNFELFWHKLTNFMKAEKELWGRLTIKGWVGPGNGLRFFLKKSKRWPRFSLKY